MLRRYLKPLGWLEGLTVILVLAGAVLTFVNGVLGGGVLGVAAVLVVTKLALRALEWVRKRREQIEEEEKRLRIRRPISEVDPFEEGLIFRSALAERGHEGHEPPYVHRDRDPSLREALETKQLVLVLGPSKAGKSRTAFEAARRMQPEPTLLVPASPEALRRLLDLGLPVDGSRPGVLWLDDLDRYLEELGMSRALFEDLGKSGSRVVVLATMTWTAYYRLRSSEGEIGKSAREILGLFETAEINLPNELSDSEREEAESLYPDQHFVAGIGEHFAAARELLDKFKGGIEVHRHGFAVVVAALDWRRAGMSRPITEAELRELYAVCLEHFFPLLRAKDEGYQAGLAWACDPLESRAALLMPATEEGVEGFEIFDYVRDWSDAVGGDFHPGLRAVPEPAWSFVVSRAGPEEAFAVGYAAYTRDNLDAAEDAWAKAVNSDESDVAPMAAFNLGLLLQKQEEYARAEEAYRQAIDSRHADWALAAALNLGFLLAEREEYEQAEQAFQQAINSGHADLAPMAANNLGLVLEKQEEYEQAEQAYQRAIDSRHADTAPWAAVKLGNLLEEQGEYARAEQAFQQAIDSGHSECVPEAAFNLGDLIREQGEHTWAMESYQQAIDSGHPDAAPKAACNLGFLLAQQRKYDQAKAAFQQAIDSGHPAAAPAAAFNLGVLLTEQGEYVRAKAAYQQAIDSGHPQMAPLAARALERLRSSCSEEEGG